MIALDHPGTVGGEMPTRKQQKRRHKRLVHGSYDAPMAPEERERRQSERDARRAERAEQQAVAAKASSRSSRGRTRRQVPEPSWYRSARKGALVLAALTAFFFLAVSKQDRTVGAYVTTAVIMTGVFIPFDYLMSRFMWRKFGAGQTQPRT